MSRKTTYSTHIGAASIMLIFMVLSLVSFSALTVVNSKADYNLSSKMMERSESYYRACHEANAFIAEISSRLEEANDPSDGTEYSKSIYISDYQTLDVTIKAADPKLEKGRSYKILSYKVTTHDENIKLDESLPVMK